MNTCIREIDNSEKDGFARQIAATDQKSTVGGANKEE